MRRATRRLLLFGGANVKDPDARAYGAAVGLLTTDPRLKLIETLIVSLKTAGVWPLLDRLWLFAAQNATQALTDLVTRATATAVNSPTLTTDRGYAGNATTSYVNTNYTPSTDKVALSLNSAHLSLYTNSGGQGRAGGGNVDHLHMFAPFGDGKMYARINGPNSGGGQGAALGLGCFIGDRTGSNAVVNAFNGTDLGTDAAASSGIPSQALYVCAQNINGAVSQASSGQHGAFSVGGSLGSAGRSALYSAVLNYMTSVGAQ